MSIVHEGVPPLFADDIAAMRAAETVYFRRDYDGASYVKLVLSGSYTSSAPRVYTARQQRLFPHTSNLTGDRYRKVTAACYVSSVHGDNTAHARCNHTLYRTEEGEWRTIVHQVKPGDIVELRWKTGNDCQLITDAGLHRDELRMSLNRRTFSPVYLIDAVVCANNSASMIQY